MKKNSIVLSVMALIASNTAAPAEGGQLENHAPTQPATRDRGPKDQLTSKVDVDLREAYPYSFVEVASDEFAGDNETDDTIRRLRESIGNEVEIKAQPLIKAKFGTQDGEPS